MLLIYIYDIFHILKLLFLLNNICSTFSTFHLTTYLAAVQSTLKPFKCSWEHTYQSQGLNIETGSWKHLIKI